MTTDLEPASAAAAAAFDALARTWPLAAAERYASALTARGRYLREDAELEARAVAQVMARGFLQPYLFGGKQTAPQAFSAALSAYRDACPDPGVFVLGSGNIGVPVILNVALALAADKRVWVRASRDNHAAVVVWHEALASAEHAMARTLAARVTFLQVDHGAEDFDRVLRALPVQQAYLWGGANALDHTASVLSGKLPEHAIYRFGPRTGVLVCAAPWWHTQTAAAQREIAAAVYENLTRYDAALCSAPTFGIAVGEHDEVATMLAEMTAAMTAAPEERARFARLPAANAYRRQMRRWATCGYRLFAPPASAVLLALGDLAAYAHKNEQMPAQHSYYDGTGALELVRVDPSELDAAAKLIAGLQNEPRYQGHLWSIGHLVQIADATLTDELTQAIERVQPPDPQVIAAKHLRRVDVRRNLGREPGAAFDGVDLVDSFFAR